MPSIGTHAFTKERIQVSKARLELFARKQRSYDAIPPTLDALMEHTNRAVYQGGHVWGQTLECFHCLPSPENQNGPLQQLSQPLVKNY